MASGRWLRYFVIIVAFLVIASMVLSVIPALR